MAVNYHKLNKGNVKFKEFIKDKDTFTIFNIDEIQSCPEFEKLIEIIECKLEEIVRG